MLVSPPSLLQIVAIAPLIELFPEEIKADGGGRSRRQSVRQAEEGFDGRRWRLYEYLKKKADWKR